MSELPRRKKAPSQHFWASTWREFRRYPFGMAGLVIVTLMGLTAIFSPLLANDQPILCKYEGRWYAPALIDAVHQIPFTNRLIQKSKPFRFESFSFRDSFNEARGDWALRPLIPYDPLEICAIPLEAPSATHMLGTDEVGRDVLSRVIHGAGVSMRVGFISMGLAVLIGLFFGSLAGYFGGWIDIVISRFIEIIICFPTFFLILSILAWFPPRIENVMILIGLTHWVGIARYCRAEFLKLREQDFALAARAMGASTPRIIFRHLLPNSLAPVMISVTFGIADAILIEAALSWLGFGVQPPQPSWGNILRSGYEALFTAPHLIPPACILIFASVLAFNLVGDALRDVIDPRLQGARG